MYLNSVFFVSSAVIMSHFSFSQPLDKLLAKLEFSPTIFFLTHSLYLSIYPSFFSFFLESKQIAEVVRGSR